MSEAIFPVKLKLKDIQLSANMWKANDISDIVNNNCIVNYKDEQHISGTLSVNTLSATAYNGLGDLAEKDISNLTSTSIAKSSDNKLCVNYSGIENNVSTTINEYQISSHSDPGTLIKMLNFQAVKLKVTFEGATSEEFLYALISSDNK